MFATSGRVFGVWTAPLKVALNRIQQRLEEIDLVEDSPEGRERVADQVRRIVREEVAGDSDEEVGEDEQGAVPPQE